MIICDSSAPFGNSPSPIAQSSNQTSAVVPFNSFNDVLCVSTKLLLTTATSTSPLDRMRVVFNFICKNIISKFEGANNGIKSILESEAGIYHIKNQKY
jgi:hypothetical protein